MFQLPWPVETERDHPVIEQIDSLNRDGEIIFLSDTQEPIWIETFLLDENKNLIAREQIFNETIKERPTKVIHLGDIVAPTTITFFEGLKMKFIKGNCDARPEKFKKRAESIGGEYAGNLLEMDILGKKIAAIHGDDKFMLEKLINSGMYDYVLHGHTHVKRDQMFGKTRVINPGAHYYGAENTIALLDIVKDKLEFVELK